MNSIIFILGIASVYASKYVILPLLHKLQQWYRNQQYNRFKTHMNRFMNELENEKNKK